MLVNKYIPNSLTDCNINKDIANILLNMCQNSTIPHLLFYGPVGSGKKTLIKLLIKELYGDYAKKTFSKIYNIPCSGNKIVEVEIEQSICHIIIEPNGNNFDKYLLQDVIKDFLNIPISFEFGKRSKLLKTILIYNANILSHYAQASLRSTIETYSTRCRFIMCSESLSQILSPLISRCFCISVPKLSDEIIVRHAFDICAKERLMIPLNTITYIINKADGNLEKLLWFLECYKYDIDLSDKYDVYIMFVIQIIMTCELKYIKFLNSLTYNITTITMTCVTIIIDITNYLLSLNISNDSKDKIIKIASEADYYLVGKRREIMPFGYFVSHIMYILYKDKTFTRNIMDETDILNFMNKIKKNNPNVDASTIDKSINNEDLDDIELEQTDDI
ncbi:replication factor C small subunit [Hokovirus HKV1]|uniref:Replication factor C small subunit n=1 Tax=Hokovirus HKV1 TaxID=1977638 RepID=A0A1V0SG03_9VIRU|nr:replication factor C small subunit [Hokovirus HKV1]